jgi:hypothetical protein
MFCVNQRLDVLKHASFVCCVASYGVVRILAESAVGVNHLI